MNKNIKLLSLFSGIGAFEKALHNIGVNYELVNYCEIDKFASKSYSLIHNVDESKNLIDVTKVDTSKLPKDIDMITYGFPCQDISSAGKQRGFFDSEGKITRSGLFFEALRIINDTKPKVAICENVKALTSKKFTDKLSIILEGLEEAGYNNYYQVLSACDYGIPQNRERIFIVSIRKDIDNGKFIFPKPLERKPTVDDFLEENCEYEYYYRSDKIIKSFMKKNGFGRFDVFMRCLNHNRDYAMTITTKDGVRSPSNFVKYVNGKMATDKTFYPVNGYENADCDGRKTLNNLLTTNSDRTITNDVVKIRRLTEKECFRLMGFDDKDCDILKDNGISSTQIYKQAGNSIVVNVLEALFKELFKVI